MEKAPTLPSLALKVLEMSYIRKEKELKLTKNQTSIPSR